MRGLTLVSSIVLHIRLACKEKNPLPKKPKTHSNTKYCFVCNGDDWYITKKLGVAHERHLKKQFLAGLLAAALPLTMPLLAANDRLEHAPEDDAQWFVSSARPMIGRVGGICVVLHAKEGAPKEALNCERSFLHQYLGGQIRRKA